MGDHSTPRTAPLETSCHRGEGDSRGRAGGSLSPTNASQADECYRDPWQDVLDRTSKCASPPRQRRSGLANGGGCHLGDCPPRSPGADSYGVLRRKRHAAVSLDYEAITRELPQVRLFYWFASETLFLLRTVTITGKTLFSGEARTLDQSRTNMATSTDVYSSL